MFHSIPGAGDILGNPETKLPESRASDSQDSSGVSADAFDSPAASGIGANPNHPQYEDIDGDDAVRGDAARQAARHFVDRVGGIQRALELIREISEG